MNIIVLYLLLQNAILFSSYGEDILNGNSESLRHEGQVCPHSLKNILLERIYYENCTKTNFSDSCERTRILSCDNLNKPTLEVSDHPRITFTDSSILITSFQSSQCFFDAPIGTGFFGFPPNVLWWCQTFQPSSGVIGFSVGRYSTFGRNITIFLDGHHCYRRVSSYPWFVRYQKLFEDENFVVRVRKHPKHWSDEVQCKDFKPVRILNDVHIGENTIIMPGVTVGDGAIIESYSVVRNDVEPYSIVIGNPAVRVGYRFQPEVISELLQIKWWEWSDEKIDANMDVFLVEDKGTSFMERFHDNFVN